MTVRAPTRPRLRLRSLLRSLRRSAPAPVVTSAPAWTPPPLPGTWSGEGIVRSVDAEGRPRLVLSDERGTLTLAEWALPYRYEPAAGDVLRVIGSDGRTWVVGVLHGRGRSVLLFRDGLALRARVLRLTSDVAVRLRAAKLTLRAEGVDLVTEVVHIKLGRARQRIDRIVERVGAACRVVDGEDWSQAQTRTIVAQGPVVVDGEQLKVG